MKNGIPMEIYIDKDNKYNKALEKAKVKYKDAIRGRDYQDELLLRVRFKGAKKNLTTTYKTIKLYRYIQHKQY